MPRLREITKHVRITVSASHLGLAGMLFSRRKWTISPSCVGLHFETCSRKRSDDEKVSFHRRFRVTKRKVWD